MDTLFAYLDAGSGALLVQLLVGGLAGIASFARFRWRKLFRQENPEAGGLATEGGESESSR